VPAWLHALVLKGLSPKPEQRFQNMEALLAILAKPPLDKRLVAGVSALVLAVLSLTAWLAVREVQRRRDDLCLSASECLAVVWSPQTRADVKRAMEATGKPYAGSTWEAAEREVAHFVEVWNREYQAACAQERSGDIRATASARVTQLCLESRLDSLELVVGEAKAEGLRLDTWLPTLEDLSSLESCTESEVWVEPEDPQQRTRFRELRGELERARMLTSLGKETASLPVARRVADAAREQGFRRLGPRRSSCRRPPTAAWVTPTRPQSSTRPRRSRPRRGAPMRSCSTRGWRRPSRWRTRSASSRGRPRCPECAPRWSGWGRRSAACSTCSASRWRWLGRRGGWRTR
jgi:hypothetical protein